MIEAIQEMIKQEVHKRDLFKDQVIAAYHKHFINTTNKHDTIQRITVHLAICGELGVKWNSLIASNINAALVGTSRASRNCGRNNFTNLKVRTNDAL